MQLGVRRRGWLGLRCVLSSALFPMVVMAQIEPASSPVPADDLTPYAGMYTIAAPGVAKATYLDVLERHLQADDAPVGTGDVKSRLIADMKRLEDNPHDTVVNSRDDHTWMVSAPTGAAMGESSGLLVFISPSNEGRVPGHWQGAAEKHGLIWVGPNEAGNQVSTLWRIAVALESVDLATRRYTIDPDRVYIAGHSGGARVASTVAFYYPDRFNGGMYFAGVNWYEPAPAGTGRLIPASIGKPPDSILDVARNRSRHAIVHGTDDTVATYVPSLWDVIRQSDFRTFAYLSVEGHGHSLPDAEWLERALAVLDGPER